MEISNHCKNNVMFISLIGQLWQKEDISALEDVVTKCMEEKRKNIVIDMQRLSFINSQGLGLLVRMHSTMTDAGNRLVLFSNPSSVLEVLEISGLESFMTIAKCETDLNEILAKIE
jgi:anti-anti-sigma factor